MSQTDLFEPSGGAQLDADGIYRYRLWRRWSKGDRRVLFAMLNPSTADAERDDPTLRSCMRLARAHGFDALEVVNLFAYRATDPRELAAASASLDVIGEFNDNAIADAAKGAAAIVIAWGVVPNALRKLHQPDTLRWRHRIVAALLDTHRPACAPLQCLGWTRAHWPRHPLYTPTNVRLLPY